MDREQADQIIDFTSGLFRPANEDATRQAWRSQLAKLDAENASKAIINGAQVWERFPSWSQFLVEYRMLEHHDQDYANNRGSACLTCQDGGFVIAQLRYDQKSRTPKQKVGPFEEMAPCPHCKLGERIEFELYGAEGYWQGRTTEHLRTEAQERSEKEPTWVQRWRAARAAGDLRLFPEQYPALAPHERPQVYFSDDDAWVQPGEHAGKKSPGIDPLQSALAQVE